MKPSLETTTPELRLCETRLRGADMSSPKKKRNSGSLVNGEFCRTTFNDVMFMTLGIARLATLDRSGRPAKPAAAGAGDCGADCGASCGEAARASSAIRVRPVSTMPAAKPQLTKMN